VGRPSVSEEMVDSLSSYLNVSDEVSHPYKTTGKIIVKIYSLVLSNLPFFLVFLLSLLPSSFASFNFPFYESDSK
jgi:hypothetical protein